MMTFTASTRFCPLLSSRAHRENLYLVEAVHPGTPCLTRKEMGGRVLEVLARGGKEAIFRSVLLECMHMRFANTFGLGEVTAAIVEILDILGKTPQLQISVISREKKVEQYLIIYLNLSHVRALLYSLATI